MASVHNSLINKVRKFCDCHTISANQLAKETGYTNAFALLNGKSDWITHSTAETLETWLACKEDELKIVPLEKTEAGSLSNSEVRALQQQVFELKKENAELAEENASLRSLLKKTL